MVVAAFVRTLPPNRQRTFFTMAEALGMDPEDD
jgi:hypothetical protein